MRQKAKIFISLILVLTFAAALSGAAGAGVTLVDLPESSSETELMWQKKFSDTFFKAPSVPAIYGDSMYIMTGNELSRLDRFTGEVTGTAALKSRCVFSTVPVVFSGDTAVCPMVDGIVQAFDTDTLEEKWTYTDPVKGQCLTEPVIAGGLVFTAFWYGETNEGSFVCIDLSTGEAVWRYVRPGGFYGTVACIVDGCVIIGCEDATAGSDGSSQLICLDALTGSVLSVLDTAGDIRSGVAYDDISGRMFVVSKAGYLYSFALEGDKLTGLETLRLPGSATSRPVIYNGRLYIGTGGADRDSGKIAVIDPDTLSIIHTVVTPGYCQCELTVKPCFDDYKTVTVYAACNCPPGSIIAFTDGEGVTSAEARIIYSPSSPAYCLSPLVIADTGEFYYKNDSCTVFALRKPGAGVHPVYMKIFRIITAVVSVFRNAGFFG